MSIKSGPLCIETAYRDQFGKKEKLALSTRRARWQKVLACPFFCDF